MAEIFLRLQFFDDFFQHRDKLLHPIACHGEAQDVSGKIIVLNHDVIPLEPLVILSKSYSAPEALPQCYEALTFALKTTFLQVRQSLLQYMELS